jgi:hypothetical protein
MVVHWLEEGRERRTRKESIGEVESLRSFDPPT